MNTLPTLARVCTRYSSSTVRPLYKTKSSQVITSRIQSCQSLHTHSQARRLSTNTRHFEAQPIDLPTSIPLNESPSSSTIDNNNNRDATTPLPPQTLSTTSPYHLTGTVTRTGTMQSCVQITRLAQEYDTYLHKHYTRPQRDLVHDPNPSGYLVEGDIVEFGPWSPAELVGRQERKEYWEEQSRKEIEEHGIPKGKKGGKGKTIVRQKWRGPKMVVRRIVTAFGVGIDERMERIVAARSAVEAVGENVVPANKGGKVGKQHASAKVAG